MRIIEFRHRRQQHDEGVVGKPNVGKRGVRRRRPEWANDRKDLDRENQPRIMSRRARDSDLDPTRRSPYRPAASVNAVSTGLTEDRTRSHDLRFKDFLHHGRQPQKIRRLMGTPMRVRLSDHWYHSSAITHRGLTRKSPAVATEELCCVRVLSTQTEKRQNCNNDYDQSNNIDNPVHDGLLSW